MPFRQAIGLTGVMTFVLPSEDVSSLQSRGFNTVKKGRFFQLAKIKHICKKGRCLQAYLQKEKQPQNSNSPM